MTAEFFFDFKDFQVGTSETRGPTGCTVFRFPADTIAVSDIRGGSAATRETALLEAGSGWNTLDGLVFAGGSTYGLAAADGVMEALKAERNQATGFSDIPCVPSAVVYDFQDRNSPEHPTRETGLAAWSALRSGQVTIGRAGAGTNVTVGKLLGRKFAEKSGQGASFLRVGPYRIFTLVVLNAYGHILGPDGQVLAGSRDPDTGEHLDASRILQRTLKKEESPSPSRNTTLSVVITDAPLDRSELTRLAASAHTSLGRVIEPFQTAYDGDVLFAVRIPSKAHARPLAIDPSLLALGAGSALQQSVWSCLALTLIP
jgi:L-aminopeptidase/D-esterase-like protein